MTKIIYAFEWRALTPHEDGANGLEWSTDPGALQELADQYMASNLHAFDTEYLAYSFPLDSKINVRDEDAMRDWVEFQVQNLPDPTPDSRHYRIIKASKPISDFISPVTHRYKMVIEIAFDNAGMQTFADAKVMLDRAMHEGDWRSDDTPAEDWSFWENDREFRLDVLRDINGQTVGQIKMIQEPVR